MAATLALQKCSPAFTLHGGPPPVLTFPEAASQTFVAGEAVYLNGGYVTECGANPVAILGIAAENAHNSTAGAYNVAVILADPETVFRANFCSASGTVTATVVTIVGHGALTFVDTTNSVFEISSGTPDAANSRVMVVGLDPADALGDIGGHVLFTFKQTYYQLGCTS